jgi:hypothetical protein
MSNEKDTFRALIQQQEDTVNNKTKVTLTRAFTRIAIKDAAVCEANHYVS